MKDFLKASKQSDVQRPLKIAGLAACKGSEHLRINASVIQLRVKRCLTFLLAIMLCLEAPAGCSRATFVGEFLGELLLFFFCDDFWGEFLQWAFPRFLPRISAMKFSVRVSFGKSLVVFVHALLRTLPIRPCFFL